MQESLKPAMLNAMARNTDDTGWLYFTNPVRVITATLPSEVLPALAEIEALCETGLTAIGFVSYEAAPAFDPALVCHPPQGPLLLFALYERGETMELPQSHEPELQLAPELGRLQWRASIATIKQHLRQGDSYQVNLTQRLRGNCPLAGIPLFAGLYAQQPSPLALYLDWQTGQICSVSPELFFALDGDRISMAPMKGTRARSADPVTDRSLRDELINSEKERAENLMIVDMVRNDLGRIARTGSVRVSELFQIVQLPTLWQQISRIEARTDATLAELMSALFPCASITGAPKARTMEIIKSCEISPRGVYTGALGIIGPGRQMRFSVGIRSLTLDRRTRTASYGVGSGIVWDSQADSEWQETLLKAQILNRSGAELRLLETLRLEPREGVCRLAGHLQRLQSAADFFGLELDQPEIRRRLEAARTDAPGKARLTVSEAGNISLEISELPDFVEPVRLRLAREPIAGSDNYLRFKTTRRQVYEQARAAAVDCDDVILWNQDGELTETSIYNLYLEIDGELFTPSLQCGLLGGVYRQSLLDSGRAKEAVLRLADLERADRLFVSNSVRGLLRAELLLHPLA